MPKPTLEEQEQVKHVHRWIFKTQDEDYCDQYYNGNPCIAIRISESELQKREEEWAEYFRSVMNTRAYDDFKQMQEAYVKRNKPKIKEIMKRIETRQRQNDYEMEKPRVPDPSFFPYEVRS